MKKKRKYRAHVLHFNRLVNDSHHLVDPSSGLKALQLVVDYVNSEWATMGFKDPMNLFCSAL